MDNEKLVRATSIARAPRFHSVATVPSFFSIYGILTHSNFSEDLARSTCSSPVQLRRPTTRLCLHERDKARRMVKVAGATRLRSTWLMK